MSDSDPWGHDPAYDPWGSIPHPGYNNELKQFRKKGEDLNECNQCGALYHPSTEMHVCGLCDCGHDEQDHVTLPSGFSRCNHCDCDLYEGWTGKIGKKQATFNFDKEASVVPMVQCDRCFTLGYDLDNLHHMLNEGWKKPNDNKYDDTIFCPDCWKKNDFCHECGYPELGKYNQCIDCDGDDEEYEEKYKNSWGFGKKQAINYFSLDEPNSAIMPGMAQNGSVEEPTAESGLATNFPTMRDYEDMESTTASKTAGWMNMAFCNECGDTPEYGDFVPSDWHEDELGEKHLCHKCFNPKIHCPKCLEPTIGKYGQCTGCDGDDEDYSEDYAGDWGLKKKGTRLNVIRCDEPGCGNTTVTNDDSESTSSLGGSFMMNEQKNPRWGITETGGSTWPSSAHGAKHYCPGHAPSYCCNDDLSDHHFTKSGCGSKLIYGKCPNCDGVTEESIINNYQDVWGLKDFNKESSKLAWDSVLGMRKNATALIQCDGCKKTETFPEDSAPDEFDFDHFYDQGWEGSWMHHGPHFCPNCIKTRCPSCYDHTDGGYCKDCAGGEPEDIWPEDSDEKE